MKLDKENIKKAASDVLNAKIKVLSDELDTISEALSDNTKSTAGDKHETSRAHAQIEQERVSNQLSQLNRMRDMLSAIKTIPFQEIQAGSLVQLKTGFFYISVPLGELHFNGEKIFCLSPSSPLAQQMLNKSKGDSIQLNGNEFVIENAI